MTNKLIVKGTDAQNYGPAQNVTRAELAAMIIRSIGLHAVQTTAFADVSSVDWFQVQLGPQ